MAAPPFSNTPMPMPYRQMPCRIHPLCILGMGLGDMVMATVLWERQASLLVWTALLLATLVWPHAACLLIRRATDPYAVEIRNLLIDSALVAALVPLMHFNLLPSVMLLTLTTMDRITTDVRGLWVHALWMILAADVTSMTVMGLHQTPKTSIRVIVACPPMMSLHTLLVGAVSYQPIRRSACQDQTLDELRHMDALTGLFGYDYRQEQAEAASHRHHTADEPACMLMLDIDHFEEVNDTYGHIVGDEVTRALVYVMRGNVHTGGCTGHYGGDEFAVMLPDIHTRDTLAITQRIHERTEGVRLRSLPELRITSSIGTASAGRHHSSLRVWVDATNAALYVAKSGGHSQVAGCMGPALVPAV